MLVFMVRGLSSGLQFPYAQFPCNALRGDQVFHVLWKAVGRLERYGFKVIGVTCDGLAANRRFIRLHAPRGNAGIVHKVKNPYFVEDCDFFFSLILDMLTDLWITIRGFSFASSFLEMYKQEKKKGLQRSKALRKEIN